MAPKDPFPQPQQDWIKSHFAEYMSKIGVNKPREPHQPEPKNDADLKEWLEARWVEFRDEFSAELEDDSRGEAHWKEKFKRKFFNKKNHPAKASSTSATALLLAVRGPFKGRDVFRDAVASEINALVADTRKRRGQDTTAHAGLFQSELKRRWDILSPEEQASYVAQAEAKNDAARGDSTMDANQDRFANAIDDMLKNLIGDGPHQLGHASFTVLWGMRSSSNMLKLGSLFVAGSEDSTDFTEESTGWTAVIDEWNDHCATNLPRYGTNIKIERDASGDLIFPSFDPEHQTAAAGRAILTGYLEAVWEENWPRDADMRSLPWEDMADHPEDYIQSTIIPSHIRLVRPSILSLTDFLSIMDAILQASKAADRVPFLVFYPKETIINARQVRTSSTLATHDSPIRHQRQSEPPEEIIMTSPITFPTDLPPEPSTPNNTLVLPPSTTSPSLAPHMSPSAPPQPLPTSTEPAPVLPPKLAGGRGRGGKRKVDAREAEPAGESSTAQPVAPANKKKARRDAPAGPSIATSRPVRDRKAPRPPDASPIKKPSEAPK
ncbi:hypothetical protein HWV62_16150, partial [Athelia sp. TMB]